MSWMDKLERRFGRYAIRGLMKYITILTGVVFLMGMLDPSGVFVNNLVLDPSRVAQGEIWRLVTYIFIPQDSNPIWILFTLYLYYMIGTNLENVWGSFRFNLYYLIGMVGTTIAVYLAGGFGTAMYLNMSLFLAYAYMFPDQEFQIYFVLPIKVKYLGLIYWVYLIIEVVTAPLIGKVAALASVINFFVFFAPGILRGSNRRRQSYNRRQDFRKKKEAAATGLVQRCEVCGITHKDDPNMEFRYCSKCEGRHCYCMNHIRNHEHVVTSPEDKVINFPGNRSDNQE